MTTPTLLITGATGNQGGATIGELLRRPRRHHLCALVRNTHAPKAKALAEHGVELVPGNLDDEGSLRAALRGVAGVLSVQTPMGQGPEGEERQGIRLATLAHEAGVSLFIQCSAAGVGRTTSVPHFQSKLAIERHIAAIGLPATILRPAAFMENFDSFIFRTTMLAMMRTYLAQDQRMQVASARDVGWFAAEAFDDPNRFIGQAIEIAGDDVTKDEAAKTLNRTGHGPAVSFVIPGLLRAKLPDDFRLMFEWIAREGFNVDIAAVRRAHPGLLSLAAWGKVSDSHTEKAHD